MKKHPFFKKYMHIYECLSTYRYNSTYFGEKARFQKTHPENEPDLLVLENS